MPDFRQRRGLTLNPHQPPTTEQIVTAEQVALLFQPFVLSLVATVAAAVLFVAAQWGIVAHDLVVIWVALLTAVTLLRVLLALMYKRIGPGPAEARAWGNLFALGAALAGLSWGAGSFLMFPPDNFEHQIIVVLVLLGMCSGATTSLSVMRRAAYLFLVPAMLPVTVVFLVQGHDLSTIVALMLILSFGFFLISTRNIHRNTQQNIRLRLAAEQKERSLALAKEQVEAASQAKSDFLANISHEFRTPMNIILGMNHMVLQTRLDDRQKDALGKVQRAAESLLDIINAILDFSRAQSGTLEVEPKPFSLHEELARLRHAGVTAAVAKGLKFAIDQSDDVPDALVGDAVRLGQVLQSLVGNAIKFTERGEVGVQVTLDSREGDQVRVLFSVTDTGPGIERSKLDSVFQPFSQGDSSRTRRHGGTGMGLAVAYKLVDLMGGRMWVDSQIGSGSTFFFDITFTAGSEAPTPGDTAAVAAGHPVQKGRRYDGRGADLRLIAPLLRRLYAQSQNYDVEAAATLGELAALLPEAASQPHLAELQRCIGGYGFDEALARIADLAQGLGVDLQLP